jgi:outer membrane protein assembly factor BamB
MPRPNHIQEVSMAAQFSRAWIVLVTAAGFVQAGNWPGWRGPNGDGHCPEWDLPLKWSATDNVRWKVPLPDAGNSTPAIWGDRIFLTQATRKGTRRAVMCLARADGRVLWQKETVYEDKEPTHATNPYCSASPVTDGRRVIASLGSAGMVCYDFEGQVLRRKDLGKLHHIWGNASSPILHGDLVILWCGPGERQFLLAVDKKDGQTVWEQKIPGGKRGDGGAESWLGSWSTPIVVKVDDHDELIVPVPEKLKGFDPKTGRELWSCAGLGKLVYTSPVHSQGIVVVFSGFHGPAMAVRLGGKGDVTGTHRLWRHSEKIPQRIGSPVIVGARVYLLNENGAVSCLALKTGKELWQNARVGGQTWGSLVVVDGRLYVTNMAGDTFVVAADSKFRLLAKNALGERVLASIAVSNGELFIRSYKHLWCIRNLKSEIRNPKSETNSNIQKREIRKKT